MNTKEQVEVEIDFSEIQENDFWDSIEPYKLTFKDRIKKLLGLPFGPIRIVKSDD